MCLADLYDVLLCARCVSLTFTVCPMCYRVLRHMWRCVRKCVHVIVLTDSSVSASGVLTDVFYDVICA